MAIADGVSTPDKMWAPPLLNTELHRRIAREGLARPSTLASAVTALARIRSGSEPAAVGPGNEPRHS